MMNMKRASRYAVVAVTIAAVAVPAAALAAGTELGATHSPVGAPVCPPGVSSAACTIILTRVTALETLRDGVAYPTKVKQAGRITAFTVGLSELSTNKATRKSYIHYLDQTYGGTTQVAIPVLRPAGAKKAQFRWQVVA